MENQLVPIEVETMSEKIQSVVKNCSGIMTAEIQDFAGAFVLANSVRQLREIFDTPEIKETIESMKDSRLGFLTDRGPKSGSSKPAYTYPEIKECCIEALMRGYALTGNEFNIIAGNFYPAKAGKYRKIMETPGISDFRYTTTSPKYDGKSAKVQCWADWKINGVKQSIGYKTETTEDTCVIQIKTNAYMGDDGVTGKAQSKLFTRVLQRLGFMITEETTDIPPQKQEINVSSIEDELLNGPGLKNPTIPELQKIVSNADQESLDKAWLELKLENYPEDNDHEGWMLLANAVRKEQEHHENEG